MKDMAHRVFVDVWRLAYKYRFRKLGDDEWESLVNDGEKLFERYKGTNVEYLFRCLFAAVRSFYESMGKQQETMR